MKPTKIFFALLLVFQFCLKQNQAQINSYLKNFASDTIKQKLINQYKALLLHAKNNAKQDSIFKPDSIYVISNYYGKGVFTYQYNNLGLVAMRLERGDKDTALVNSKRYFYEYDVYGNLLNYYTQIWENGAWKNQIKYIYEYEFYNNQLKKKVQIIQFDQNNAWKNSSRYTYNYDSCNNLISEVFEEWVGTNWRLYGRFLYEYDANHNNTKHYMQQWNQAWINTDLYTYEYNEFNYLTKAMHQTWDFHNWNNEWKMVYEYDSIGRCLSLTDYYWSNNHWEISWRDTIVYYSNYHCYSLMQDWQNGQWIDFFRNTYIIDSVSNNLLYYCQEKKQNGQWQNYYRNISNYINHIYLESFISQQGYDSVWVNGLKLQNQFDADFNIIQADYYNWSDSLQQWIQHDYEATIFNFEFPEFEQGFYGKRAYIHWTKNISVNMETPNYLVNGENDNVVLFPNPTHSFVSLTGIEPNATLFIYDNNGKLLEIQKANGDNIILNLSHLKQGQYFIKIQNLNRQILKKVLKY